eukprot:1403964-Pleurochrysis_carterae.AAC.1
MRHATREGNKPYFWTYLKENGCRGCQEQGKEETIHHVLSGECETIGRKMNSRYREEIRRASEKCREIMNDKQISAGVVQVNIHRVHSHGRRTQSISSATSRAYSGSTHPKLRRARERGGAPPFSPGSPPSRPAC